MIPSTSASTNDMEIENGDIMKIFLDNGTNQLEDKFFLSKKKLLNAQKGKNELFDMLKMKLKGLDMQIALMQSNKDLLKGEDLICVETLLSLITVAKNDKVLFPPIYKKIKSLTTLLIKNQTNIKIEANYPTLVKFVVYILNLGYEHSTFQQLTDLMGVDETLIKLFCDELFNKLFKGRNVNVKAKDTKFIIRFLMTKYVSPCNIIMRMLSYLRPKDNGGARTPHQVNLILSLIGYVGDLILSKADQLKFKEKEIGRLINAFREAIKEDIYDDRKMEDNDSSKQNNNEDAQGKKNKQQVFLIEFESVYSKLITMLSKCNYSLMESQVIKSKRDEMTNELSDIMKKHNVVPKPKVEAKQLKENK